MFEKVEYGDLNARQKENYNFQKVASRLADYGFNCLRLTDDWQGADFLACHINGETVLKVQLKGRLTIAKKYEGKSIYVAFVHRTKFDKTVFVYNHDSFVDFVQRAHTYIVDSDSWKKRGLYSWPKPTEWAMEFLMKHGIQESTTIPRPSR